MRRKRLKVAFLFLTRGDVNQPRLWSGFFQAACPDDYSVYCHPKFPSSVVSPFLCRGIVPNPIATNYGHISLVRATMSMLEQAVRNDSNALFVLVSESCIPLFTLPIVRRSLLEINKSMIWYGVPPDHDEEAGRRYASLKPPSFVSRDRFYKQSQWMCLDRAAAEFVLKSDFTSDFEDMFAPDEHYFINVLQREGYPVQERVLSRPMTFVNWRDYESAQVPEDIVDGKIVYREEIRPRMYEVVTQEDLAGARRIGDLFFRKVSPTCRFVQ